MKPEIKEFLKKYIGEEMEFSDYEDFSNSKTGILTGYYCEDFPYTKSEDWYACCRPKQKPKYIPYTIDTVPDCLTGRYKGFNGYMHLNPNPDGVWWTDYDSSSYSGCSFNQLDYKDAFEKLEHFDGSPFGTEVK